MINPLVIGTDGALLQGSDNVTLVRGVNGNLYFYISRAVGVSHGGHRQEIDIVSYDDDDIMAIIRVFLHNV